MAGPEPCGLDTSVVVRLLTGEPPRQAALALAFLNSECDTGRPPVVSDLVVAEAYFALQHHFEVPKKEAIRALAALFNSGMILSQEGGCASTVLSRMRTRAQKPGFVDRLIHAQYTRCAKRLATFEKASAKMARTVVLR